MKKTTSPGTDGISATILKKCDCLTKPLSMTDSLSPAILPDDCKLAIVKSIYKKDNKILPSNYRPISLTSLVVQIIMEAIICDNLRQFLQTHNTIPVEQHGFVQGKFVSTKLLC